MENKNIEFILEELYKEYNIPFVIIDKKDKKDIIFPQNLKYNNCDLKLSFLKFSRPDKLVLIEEEGGFWSVFETDTDIYAQAYVLIGPHAIINMEHALSTKSIAISTLSSKEEERQVFINYIRLIFTILNNKVIDEKELEFINYPHKINSFNDIFQKNLELRKNNDAELDSIELETRLINAIIQNDKKMFNWIFNQMHKTYFARIHSDRLISLKYKYVGLIAILTRVSINNAVEKNEAYTLSDSLIQKLETIESLQECIVYTKESCFLFMKLINSDFYSIESTLVKKIYLYIDLHIYDKITLEQLSEYCQKSKNYLSAEFKKYTGLTIHNYINQRKIKEAIHILLFTNLSFTEISAKLSFSDQSHFIQKFKQVEGITPKEYRKKYQTTKLM